MRRLAGLVCLAVASTGCAAQLSSARFSDYAIPGRGASRQTVHATLGKPLESIDDGRGGLTDVYRRFDMDDNTRWMSHTVLDMATLGLWELAGIPIELVGRRQGWWRMTNYDIRLTYDRDGYLVDREIRTESKGRVTF